MEHRRPSLIGPLILITIGILLLLANLGYLPLSFWEIAWRFWPLVLILIGLDIIIGRRSRFGALIIIALWCALVAGILWLALTSGGAFLNTTLVTETINQPLADIKSATIDLNIGLATVKVAALDADTADLMRGTFRHAEGMKIGKRFNTVGNWSEWRIASAAGFPYVRPLEPRFPHTPLVYRDFPDVYDPAFAAALRRAAAKIQVLAYTCRVTRDDIALGRRVDVIL